MRPFCQLFALTLCCLPLGHLQAATSIEKLVRQLNDDQATLRDEAEQSLLKMAPTENVDKCDLFWNDCQNRSMGCRPKCGCD